MSSLKLYYEEWMKSLFIENNPEQTYTNLKGAIESMYGCKFYVVDYSYNGKHFSAPVPAASLPELLHTVTNLKKHIPKMQACWVNINVLMFFAEEPEFHDSEFNESLLSEFLYLFKSEMNIEPYKKLMLKYFEENEDFEKCVVLT